MTDIFFDTSTVETRRFKGFCVGDAREMATQSQFSHNQSLYDVDNSIEYIRWSIVPHCDAVKSSLARSERKYGRDAQPH